MAIFNVISGFHGEFQARSKPGDSMLTSFTLSLYLSTTPLSFLLLPSSTFHLNPPPPILPYHSLFLLFLFLSFASITLVAMLD